MTAEVLAAMLWQASARLVHMSGRAADAARVVMAEAPVEAPFERAGGVALTTALESLWRQGWQPVDVWQVFRRQLDDGAADFMVGAITEEAARYAAASVHPRWRAQLAQLGATPWWRPEESHVGAYADRNRLDSVTILTIVLQMLAKLHVLPALPMLIPPPGSYSGSSAGEPGPVEVDPKVLAKVRALLAKAESTGFPEEADAFFAKAQELMSRYSLERAVVEQAGGPAPVQTGGRRIWLDNPYLTPKSMLVNVVAKANRCQAVFLQALGFVTVVGEETDTEIVEVLTTSLLVQAGRAMLAAGGRVDRRGTSRTKSFRQSFLVSYAQRIGERLTEASERAESEVVQSVGSAVAGRLLPVLVAREQAVQERMAELFPNVVTRSVSVSNSAGWTAGRAAADQATLTPHPALP
jgi:hypothetical protein